MCAVYLNTNNLLFAECDLANGRVPTMADVESICGARSAIGDVSDPEDYRKCGCFGRMFVLTHEPRTLNPDEDGVRIYEYVAYCVVRLVKRGTCSACPTGDACDMVVVDMFGVKPDMRRTGLGRAFWGRVSAALAEPGWYQTCGCSRRPPVTTLQALYNHQDYLALLAKHCKPSRRQPKATVDLEAIAAELVQGTGSCAFWRAVGFDNARFDIRAGLGSTIVCPLLVMWKKTQNN